MTSRSPSVRATEIYDAYDTVRSALHSFARARHLREITPSPTATNFEFLPERSYFVGAPHEPDLLLPASNTLQKQVACGLLGSVYCVAPCFRREPPDRTTRTSLHVFHQIEVELHQAGAAEARDTALALLRHIAAAFPSRAGRHLDRVEVHDLLQLAEPPTHATYDEWLERTVDTDVATWILHLPQNPVFVVNRDVGRAHLAETFEFLLPDGFGEILSGGLRDRNTARELWHRAGQAPEPGPPTTSGFGIGLERLVAWLLDRRDLGEVTLAHHHV